MPHTLRKLFVIAMLAAAPVVAQDKPPKLEPIPEPPPPPAGVVDTDEAPEVTVSTRGEDKIEEYRIKGRLYMIKVTPKVGKPYYLVDHKGDGVFARADDNERSLSVPMWLIKSW